MSLIEWDDKYSVGVAAVDHEHRELIGLVNEAHNRLMRPGGEEAVMDFLGEIFARISAHFALEEQIMRARNYDQYDTHKADHERLLEEIRDMMDDYEDGESFSEELLAQQLQAWFAGHFRSHDAWLHRRLD
ncbi:MAG: bacteriohemerythrin [Sulfuricaulis sp.]|uniref:bacteriohemerythrin n=1 Tax=Sulfuricaulis sp. TaxID=2003553 RepID=UPI003C4536BD